MSGTTTMDLHAQADDAAGRGDFVTALRFSAEILRVAPLDGRARLKVGLCLAALGRVEDAVTVIQLLAHTLMRRGYMLSAIGACRDALNLEPGSPRIHSTLQRIHELVYGLEGRGRARVPPPSVPTVVPERDAGLLAITDTAQFLDRATKLATQDPDESDAIVGEVLAVPLFSDLSWQAFLSLVERMAYLKVPASSAIIREGERGDALFVLVQGEAVVTRQRSEGQNTLARLGAGSLFGELALIRAKPRSASVTAAIASELFQIDRELIDDVAGNHPAIRDDLSKFARRRLIMNLMATSKIFASLDDAQRFDVMRSFVSRPVEPGTVIIEDGKEPSGLFLLLEGEVEVSKIDPSGDKVVLAYLKEGEVFGEIGLLEHRLTTATVSATEKSVLLYLDRQRFEDLAKNSPLLLEYLSSLSGSRREETDQAMSADGVVLDADDLIII